MYIHSLHRIMARNLATIGVLLLASQFVVFSRSQTSSATSVVCADVPFPDCMVFNNKTLAANSSSAIIADVTNLRTLYTTVNCSDFSRFFICAATYPYCIAQTNTLRYPCRDMCMRVKEECAVVESLLNTVDIFNCATYSIGGRCITQEEALIDIRAAGFLPPEQNQGTTSGTSYNNSCLLQDTAYFTDSSKDFAKGWIATWATFCFVSTLITLLTFLIDRSRFGYPWRPIVYLALCYNIHSFGYYLSLLIGSDTVICPNDSIVRTRSSWTWQHTPCILVFIFLYSSMMAFTLWWLVLTFNWFLATALKWSNEATARLAPFYHALAWSFPLLMTVILLSTRLPAADELTGTCFIVRDDNDASFVALLLAVILPLCLILVTGCVLIVIGFVDVLKIRSFVKQSGRKTGDLEKLMLRIGIFVVIYIIPALIVISAYIYELDSQPNWRRVSQSKDNCSNCSDPNVGIFMARVFFQLIVGILSGCWIWTKKTAESWKMFFRRLTRRNESPQVTNYGIDTGTVERPNSANSMSTDREAHM